jgi:hypothetical protein
MKIYFFRSDVDQFDAITPLRESDFDRFDGFDGFQRFLEWSPLEVRVFSESSGTEDPGPGDFPYLEPHVPVFSEKAVVELGKLVSGMAELLPLSSDAGEFFAVNVACLDGALDEERSLIERFRSSGRVMRVQRHVFNPDVIRDTHIFKISQAPLMDVFVSEEFVSRVTAAGLQGFRREIAWEI